MFPSYDLELQYRCLRLVREHSDVPVPVAPWWEPDDSALGSPFTTSAPVRSGRRTYAAWPKVSWSPRRMQSESG